MSDAKKNLASAQAESQNFEHFKGTKPVSKQHEFDVSALAKWLNTSTGAGLRPIS